MNIRPSETCICCSTQTAFSPPTLFLSLTSGPSVIYFLTLNSPVSVLSWNGTARHDTALWLTNCIYPFVVVIIIIGAAGGGGSSRSSCRLVTLALPGHLSLVVTRHCSLPASNCTWIPTSRPDRPMKGGRDRDSPQLRYLPNGR